MLLAMPLRRTPHGFRMGNCEEFLVEGQELHGSGLRQVDLNHKMGGPAKEEAKKWFLCRADRVARCVIDEFIDANLWEILELSTV